MSIDKIALAEHVIAVSHRAGSAILAVYERAIAVTTKEDDSPLTEADMAAHRIICSGLAKLLDGVPVLSEESRIPSYRERSRWQSYWLVDPLDGTKEFVERNGEFTVNIALIEAGKPLLGVVYAPVSGVVYWGISGAGAFREDSSGRRSIRTRSMTQRQQRGEPLTVAVSRRHGEAAAEALLSRLKTEFSKVTTIKMGSALKLCLVAEGKADIYPRQALTAEWDTAAGQAVVEAAGGLVVDTRMEVLRYNTKESLLNPCFYVLGDKDYDWSELFNMSLSN